MRIALIGLLIVPILIGCNKEQQFTGSQQLDSSSGGAKVRTIFSFWNTTSFPVSLDLTAYDSESAPTFFKVVPTIWRFAPGSESCLGSATIDGTQDHGTMVTTFDMARSNTLQCPGLQTTYSYQRLSSGQIRVCKVTDGTCFYMIAPGN
jgi:hypothetical protein